MGARHVILGDFSRLVVWVIWACEWRVSISASNQQLSPMSPLTRSETQMSMNGRPAEEPRAGLRERLKSIRASIEEIRKISGVAGVCITVIDHDETIFQDDIGYRDITGQEPVTSDTLFHIALLTKSFTGACMYQLQA
ncbi:hypothetical protein BCR34DRAFT_593026 [Clohesyomyces aquaticus]|uniref:Beta-lactamase-related domain-containing protein n=1 Tax=Clohesyomyces aquaticus TaxID=1231657 RepID=A0A1Y1YMY7_9PLEO|nr:hypothetical protein BCR34DRAFT_593026 [Clohesyomyces aquaticus]